MQQHLIAGPQNANATNRMQCNDAVNWPTEEQSKQIYL